MFYDRFKYLCDQTGSSCTAVAVNLGLSNAIPTKWKRTGAVPEGATLDRISNYFSVPYAFFLERPPFDQWDRIDADRKGFCQAVGTDPELMALVWGVDAADPDGSNAKDFIAFVADTVAAAHKDPQGEWEIVLRDSHQKRQELETKNAPQPLGGQDADLRDLIEIYHALPAEGRQQLLLQAKQIIGYRMPAKQITPPSKSSSSTPSEALTSAEVKKMLSDIMNPESGPVTAAAMESLRRVLKYFRMLDAVTQAGQYTPTEDEKKIVEELKRFTDK